MRPTPLPGTRGSYLLTWLVATGLGGVVVLIGFFVFLGASALQKSTEQALAERLLLAQQIASNLDFALEQSTSRMARSFEDHPLDLTTDVSEPTRLALREAYHASPIIFARLSLVDRDGKVLATEPPSPEMTGAAAADNARVQEALESGLPVVSPAAALSPGGQALVYVTVPIRSRTAAVQAAIDLTRSNLSDFIRSARPGGRAYTQLVDSRGFVLASTEPRDLFTKGDHSDQFTDLISRGATTAGTCHSCHQAAPQREALAFAPLSSISDVPWGVAIREPEEDVLAPTQWLRLRLVLLGLGSLLAILVLAWGFARNVVTPLVQLGAAASRLGTGKLAEPVPTVGRGEIAELSRAFESMRGRLRGFQEELEERVKHRTRELAALVQASQTLVSTLDPKGLFTTIVRTAVNTFEGADAGILFLHDAESDRLLAAASIGYDLAGLSRVKLQPGEAIAGKVFQRRQPMLSNSPEEIASALEYASPENRRYIAEARRNLEIQRHISVPLEVDGKVLGSLVLVGLQKGPVFSPRDLQLVLAFANLAAALLQKLRLLDEAGRAEALRRTDQMKTEFLANISHELQTPLASLRASLDFTLAAGVAGLNDAQAQLLHNANRSAEHLGRLINDLMDVAKLQSGHLALSRESLDLREVVNAVAATFGPLTASKDQRLKVDLPPEPVVVAGDRRRLEQILNNLLSNAHYYTPAGGAISIELKEQDGQAVASVTDTGPGIPPEKQELVFQRFYRAEAGETARRRGMGLGLSIARGLAELHGGRLWVESIMDRGSTFRLSLPAGEQSEDTDC